MFTERIQVLMSKAQRRRLEAEARERGTSVGALIREAVDAHAKRRPLAERRRALEGIKAMRGTYISVAEMERAVNGEREEWVERLGTHPRKRRS